MRAWTVLPVLILMACAGTDASSSGWQGTITDSVGVQLVANPAAGTWTADQGSAGSHRHGEEHGIEGIRETV